LFWADDLFDKDFKPPAFDPTVDTIYFVTPRLDVIQYFQSPPTLIPERNNKTYNMRALPSPVLATADQYIMIPYWGRRYGMVEVTNKSTGPWSFELSAVNFSITTNAAGYHQITTIVADAPIAANATSKTIITATGTGMFDMLMLRFHRVGPGLDPVEGPIRIFTSDKE
jgi:hypothetical protein